MVVPKRGREAILKQLHHTHPGILRMKGLAQSYIWWPGMDADIEKEVQSCHTCHENRKSPATAPLYPWEWPETPWTRLRIDYAGPHQVRCFLSLYMHTPNGLRCIQRTPPQAKQLLRSSDSALAHTDCPRQLYLTTELASQAKSSRCS